MVGYIPYIPQTKVKTFYSDSYDVVDKEVNEFIKDKNIIDIKFHVFKALDDIEPVEIYHHHRFVIYRE